MVLKSFPMKQIKNKFLFLNLVLRKPKLCHINWILKLVLGGVRKKQIEVQPFVHLALFTIFIISFEEKEQRSGK